MSGVLVDSSAWVEYLRDTGSPSAKAVDRLLDAGRVVTTDVVRTEILAGARHDAEETALAALLAVAESNAVEDDDWLQAARLQRRCRAGGESVRRLADCLIAAVAIRAGIAVLHADRNFETLARHTALQVAYS